MSQAHSKFIVSVYNKPLTQEILDEFSSSLNIKKLIPISIGVEYIEHESSTVLSIGYTEDKGVYYDVQLKQVDMGKPKVNSDEISAALEKAANENENVICHEFYVTSDGNFYAILMCQK